jgi:hypothetical protein
MGGETAGEFEERFMDVGPPWSQAKVRSITHR